MWLDVHVITVEGDYRKRDNENHMGTKRTMIFIFLLSRFLKNENETEHFEKAKGTLCKIDCMKMIESMKILTVALLSIPPG